MKRLHLSAAVVLLGVTVVSAVSAHGQPARGTSGGAGPFAPFSAPAGPRATRVGPLQYPSVGDAPGRVFEVRRVNGSLVCREVAAESLPSAPPHDVRVFNAHVNATGLTILLRGTAQLDAYPAAKAAFARAAAEWERYITNPITINIDVDFGPTRFGVAYPSKDILGSTSSVTSTAQYSSVVSALQGSVRRQFEQDMYSRIPSAFLPTDIGNTSTIATPQASLRAIGLLAPTPSPADSTPSIGFNSAFTFDLDNSDGVAAGTYDFQSVALHEIGHVLGFSSRVGIVELSPGASVAPTILDVFRFRPGMALSLLGSALRLQSSGGSQVLYNGLWETPLSTGRPDGTGGDGQQASHWKDTFLLGYYVGVMQPALPSRTIAFATIDDLVAFDLMGYDVEYPPAPATPTNLVATTRSDTEIDLAWRDNATNESEFRLEISTAPSNWTEVGGIAANRTSATISPLKPDTAYTFRLIATNAGGYSDYSNEATARTKVATCSVPAIQVQPAPQSVTEGSTATVSVTASGSAPLHYAWYRGASGDRSAPIGGDSPALTIPDLRATTLVWVSVYNACGNVSSSAATITMVEPVNCVQRTLSCGQTVAGKIDDTYCVFSDAPDHYSYYTVQAGAGQVLDMSVTATFPPEIAIYRSDGDTVLAYDRAPTATTSRLFFTVPSSASYDIVVSSSLSQRQGTFTLALSCATPNGACQPPVITRQPLPVTIPLGSSTHLSVAATGTAPLKYGWMNNEDLTVAGATADIAVTPAKTTSYTVTVSNSCGSIQSNTAKVTVEPARRRSAHH